MDGMTELELKAVLKMQLNRASIRDALGQEQSGVQI